MAIYDYQGNEISSGGGSGYDWSNKKITFEGDSITANIGYPAYVCTQLDAATAVNIAKAGYAVYPNSPTNAADFRKKVSNIPYNTDAIVILGDTNASDFPASDADLFSDSPSTWAGRWNLALDAIKRSFPTVPLFLTACFRQSGKNNQAKYVAHAFQRFAQLWGCIFIDLSTEAPMNLLYSGKVWGLNGSDGVHPAKAFVSLYAQTVADHIRQIPPCAFTGTDSISIDATKSVAAGSTVDISYTVTGDQSVQWTSSDMDVACVLGGTVYGMAAGTATITAKTRSGKTATCTVTVS